MKSDTRKLRWFTGAAVGCLKKCDSELFSCRGLRKNSPPCNINVCGRKHCGEKLDLLGWDQGSHGLAGWGRDLEPTHGKCNGGPKKEHKQCKGRLFRFTHFLGSGREKIKNTHFAVLVTKKNQEIYNS